MSHEEAATIMKMVAAHQQERRATMRRFALSAILFAATVGMLLI